MLGSLVQRGFFPITVLLAVVSLASGVGVWLGYLDPEFSALERLVATTILLSAGVLVFAGLGLSNWSKARPMRGATCVSVGAALFGMCFWWTIIAPVAGLAVAASGLVRARRLAREQEQHPVAG